MFKTICIPINVATPFPPLKNKNIEKRWPKNTPKAAKCEAVIPKNSLAKYTTTNPLLMSIIKVKKAAFLCPVLKTFVAPILPEPISLMLPNLKSLDIKIPKGIEPIK